MIGTKIKEYTIFQVLGQGSFGRVFGVKSVDNQQYALKLISVNDSDKNNAIKQAEWLFTLNHPNILKAKQFFYLQQERCLVIILEYCPDGNLSKLIGTSSNDSFRKVIKEITEGLVYLHDNKIAHRDIKPQNILMFNQIAKIADLGISKSVNSSGMSTLIGTQYYLAPEVINGNKYHCNADVWSFGIMVLELLIGKRIKYVVDAMPALVVNFPSESLLNQIKDSEMRKLVQNMLKKNIEERLTSQDVLDFLNQKNVDKLQKKADVNIPNQDYFQKTQKFTLGQNLNLLATLLVCLDILLLKNYIKLNILISLLSFLFIRRKWVLSSLIKILALKRKKIK